MNLKKKLVKYPKPEHVSVTVFDHRDLTLRPSSNLSLPKARSIAVDFMCFESPNEVTHRACKQQRHFVKCSVKFYMVNVNEVPGALVKRGGIQVSCVEITQLSG